jgi:hypothetical protein
MVEKPTIAGCRRCDSRKVRVVNECRDALRFRVDCFWCDKSGPWRATPEDARDAWNRKEKR